MQSENKKQKEERSKQTHTWVMIIIHIINIAHRARNVSYKTTKVKQNQNEKHFLKAVCTFGSKKNNKFLKCKRSITRHLFYLEL